MKMFFEEVERDIASDEVTDALYLRDSNPHEAVIEFKKLSKRGSAVAALTLGDALINGRLGLEPDYKAGERYLLDARRWGSNEATLRLARYYEKTGNILESISLLKELSQKGLPSASYMLGWLYFTGKVGEVDLDKAKKYWSKSAKEGHLIGLRHLAYLKIKHGTVADKIAGFGQHLTALFYIFVIGKFDPDSDRLRCW